VVRTQFVSAQPDPIGRAFLLAKIDSDRKIYKFKVTRIWPVKNDRGKFAEILSRGGIDVLIQSLREKS
jgi:ABC-type transporter MlaC component